MPQTHIPRSGPERFSNLFNSAVVLKELGYRNFRGFDSPFEDEEKMDYMGDDAFFDSSKLNEGNVAQQNKEVDHSSIYYNQGIHSGDNDFFDSSKLGGIAQNGAGIPPHPTRGGFPEWPGATEYGGEKEHLPGTQFWTSP